MRLYIPLAWLQLVHNKTRFIAALGGITFVVLLLFLQLGFQDALFESAVQIHKSLQGDLFLVSTQYKSMTAVQGFPRARLYKALAVDGVASVSPLYFQFGKLKNIENGQKYSIFVFGIDPGIATFSLPEVNQNLDLLKIPDIALFDRDSRREFGPIAKQFDEGSAVSVEIASFNEVKLAYRLKIGALFSIGPSFGVDGSLIVNYSTFIQIFPGNYSDEIEIGSIMLEPNANVQKVITDLRTYLSKDVKVLSPEEFIDMEKKYWALRTPIGFIFQLMVTMGFIVGVGIAYQVLHTNISTQLIQYATLKAIGYSNQFLFGIVWKQSLILGVLGYLPGFIFACGVYDLANKATHLPVVMTLNKALTVLIVMLLMCSISGILAIQKLRSADPADIF